MKESAGASVLRKGCRAVSADCIEYANNPGSQFLVRINSMLYLGDVLRPLAWAGQQQGLLFQVLQKHYVPILCSEVLARLQQSIHKGSSVK